MYWQEEETVEIPFHRQVLRVNESGLLVDGGRFSGAARHLLLMCVFDNEKINVVQLYYSWYFDNLSEYSLNSNLKKFMEAHHRGLIYMIQMRTFRVCKTRLNASHLCVETSSAQF